MSSLSSTLASKRVRTLLPWVGGVVFFAGVVAALAVFVGNTGQSLETPLRNEPAQLVKEGEKAPLAPEARRVAGRFIQTAVQRKDLDEAWNLTGPDLRGGLSYQEWLKGEIPVIPFLAEIDKAPIKVDASYRNSALLEVLILPKKSDVKPQIFFLELKKIDGRWKVVSWVPRANIAVPTAD